MAATPPILWPVYPAIRAVQLCIAVEAAGISSHRGFRRRRWCAVNLPLFEGLGGLLPSFLVLALIRFRLLLVLWTSSLAAGRGGGGCAWHACVVCFS